MSLAVPVMFPRRSRARIVLYIASFALDAFFGWPAVLFSHLFWGVKGKRALRWEDGVLRTKINRDSWLAKRVSWGALTLSAHAILYLDTELWPEDLEAPSPLQHHEHTHVEQAEAASLVAATEGVFLSVFSSLLAIFNAPLWSVIVALILGFLIWLLGAFLHSVAGGLTAGLRGEADTYRGSHVEEAAYAKQREVARK